MVRNGFPCIPAAPDLRAEDWFPITREEVLAQHLDNSWIVYSAEKALSERAVWQFADENPHIEMTTGMHIPCLSMSCH